MQEFVQSLRSSIGHSSQHVSCRVSRETRSRVVPKEVIESTSSPDRVLPSSLQAVTPPRRNIMGHTNDEDIDYEIPDHNSSNMPVESRQSSNFQSKEILEGIIVYLNLLFCFNSSVLGIHDFSNNNSPCYSEGEQVQAEDGDKNINTVQNGSRVNASQNWQILFHNMK